jgi:hypothetical protein
VQGAGQALERAAVGGLGVVERPALAAQRGAVVRHELAGDGGREEVLDPPAAHDLGGAAGGRRDGALGEHQAQVVVEGEEARPGQRAGRDGETEIGVVGAQGREQVEGWRGHAPP